MTTTTARSPVSRGTPGAHTWDEFVRLDDDDRRELIDGQFLEGEMATELHEWIVGMVVVFLNNWALPRKAGYALPSSFRLRISERRGVFPDVHFFRAGNTARRTPQGIVEGHSDVVVEVVSPTSAGRDRVVKLEYYASIGVPEYWIVDPERRTLERLVFDRGRYAISAALEGDAVFRPAEFEGLEIPLARLWTLPGAEETGP